MRPLIITTGSAKIVLTRWLSLLRGVGEYQGDVLVLDYGVMEYYEPKKINNKVSIEKLKKEKNVTVLQPVRKLKNIFIDRFMVTQEYLKKNSGKYDVVVIMDGNDIIFWGSITYLLEKAQEKLCYVKEHFSNKLKIWGDFYPRKFIQDNFKSIEEEPIINGGMIAGPTKDIFKLFSSISRLMKKYGDEPSDQLYLDLMIYYFKFPSQELGYEWNYTHAVIGRKESGVPYGPRTPKYRDGKAYAVEDGRPIIIEHRTGTGHKTWTTRIGIQMLEDDFPIEVMAEYERSYRNWLFPNIRRKGVEIPQKAKSNWLFPN